jgi:branched-chain amino acid transport system permease protein
VLNLAHGAMFMLGGYAGWVAFSYTGSFIVAVVRRLAVRRCSSAW